ncbi:MAG: diguanylate cyclase domain-containing protein [Gammaproteobacteria bacterium]
MTKLDRAVLEQALAASRDGVVVTDAQGEDQPIVFVNPAFERITGFTSSEALGRNCRFLQGHDHEQSALADLRHAIEAHKAVEVMLRNYRKDGSMFWNRLSLSPVPDGPAAPTWWIGVIHPQKDPATPPHQTLDTTRHRVLADELKDIVRIDKTTGIFTRAWFDELFARDWAIARRERQSMTVMLFEIDFFGEYAETFGRQASDACLRLVAHAVHSSLRRAGDLSARYGSEEFIGSAKSMEERKARGLAESILDKVRALSIHHPKSSVSKYVTISIGAATTVPRHDQEPDRLVAFAREALGEAKTAGRDRVVSVVR